MKLKAYLRDRALLIIFMLLSMFLLSIYLLAVGNDLSMIFIFLLIWTGIFVFYLGQNYYRQRKVIDELFSIMDNLEDKYLFSECIPVPKDSLGRTYYTLMKRSGKSMIERVSSAKEAGREYKEYIESWVHEIKAPITAAQLIAQNNKGEWSDKLETELREIEEDVERALYYARSGTVQNDYIIGETLLSDIVHKVIDEQKRLLISNGVRIETEGLDVPVYTDGKWIEFILSQFISNSIKYRSESPLFTFTAIEERRGVSLVFRDNGVGIRPEELPRIFDKGFTGSNGRSGKGSTGIGLYLSKKLAEKLGIGVTAASRLSEYTELTLFFPKASHVRF